MTMTYKALLPDARSIVDTLASGLFRHAPAARVARQRSRNHRRMLENLAQMEDWQLEDIGWTRRRLDLELAKAGIAPCAPARALLR